MHKRHTEHNQIDKKKKKQIEHKEQTNIKKEKRLT